VEYPFPVTGSFDERFLELPDRVIVTVCAHHQRFFCISVNGRLTNRFVGISNNAPKTDVIRRGYEKVLRARLEDALFFYKEDLKKRLEDLVPRLSEVLIHPRIGNVLEKVERLRRIADRLCAEISCSEETRRRVMRAAYISKADLMTEMVREFDELQGYMGYVYALKQGEDEEVALALYEQYKPVGAEDEVPQTTTGTILALADRIDNLISFFKAGEIPRGSSDPFGLRRAALGLLRIIDEKDWDIDLRWFRDIYGSDRWEEELAAFLAGKESPLLADAYEAYRRVVKILPEGWTGAEVQESLLREKEEVALWNALRELEGRDICIQDLADLKRPLDDFFNRVLVMEKDERLKANRLALLTKAKNLFNRVADFSKLVL